MNISFESAVAVTSAVLVTISHVAAVIGKPKLIKKIGAISMLFDILAGNYGKAKNKATDAP